MFTDTISYVQNITFKHERPKFLAVAMVTASVSIFITKRHGN
jgi:hypothetical protein